MIHAYDKTYLDKARTALGRMFDYAVYELGYDIADFFERFVASDICRQFECGAPSVVAGKSGVEIANELLQNKDFVKPKYTADRSEEYWLGWALAYYQWQTSLSFREIAEAVPVKKMLSLYSPYHEMDIQQFCDKMNELYRQAKPDTNLKIRRKALGLSQKELSEISGIPLRTIQQYEQRQKSINKAQAEYLILLSRALCCKVDDIIEKVE